MNTELQNLAEHILGKKAARGLRGDPVVETTWRQICLDRCPELVGRKSNEWTMEERNDAAAAFVLALRKSLEIKGLVLPGYLASPVAPSARSLAEKLTNKTTKPMLWGRLLRRIRAAAPSKQKAQMKDESFSLVLLDYLCIAAVTRLKERCSAKPPNGLHPAGR